MYVTGVALTETRPLSAHLLTAGSWKLNTVEHPRTTLPAGWALTTVAQGFSHSTKLVAAQPLRTPSAGHPASWSSLIPPLLQL